MIAYQFEEILKDDLLSVPEADWKMLVLHEVLDMAHLVMDRVPLFEAVVVGAHLDPVVLKQRETRDANNRLIN